MASAAAELVVERELESRIEMADTNRTFVGAQGLVKMALDQYTEILTTVSDPRVSDWPLMDSPIPTFLIVLLYLYGVTILGPRVMANRKPFKLRGTLVAYNAFQVIFSLGMLYEHLMSGWLLDYSYKCQPVDYSHNPSALRMANLCWWYFISKFTEFADTIFFVLRKKESQVTFLHLYHHSLTPLETWICVKFIPGGHGTLGNLINNAVHVIMYLYYMVSAMGPEYQKYLWWKKHLTTVQLVGTILSGVRTQRPSFGIRLRLSKTGSGTFTASFYNLLRPLLRFLSTSVQ
ncbi:Elongation of very long chain fatty acids protein [Apis cerana cerana]|uniref:Elongation of very long chain fatty acids protein n=1 Tax=Apis cerana cerana TaxID=94128 RepID=A0A2A3EKR4_APICC|nr:Elongation of very long chain fatty acids protein [Apis cerana cerana]